MLQRITNYFFPHHFSGTDEEVRQAHIIVNSIFLTSLFTVNYALLSWWANFWPGVYIMVVSVGVYWSSLLLFRQSRLTFRQIGYVFVLVGSLTIFMCSYYQGGFYGEVTIWLVATPLAGAFLLGREGGLVALIFAAVFLLILWYLEHTGVVLQNFIPPDFTLLFRLNVIAGLMLIVLVIALVFSSVNDRALKLIEQKNNQLRQQSEQLQQSLEQLREAQTQLIQREKMASLGELTAGIAHEIQNPLNFVNNFSEVSGELVEELREEDAKPARDAELIGELLNDLEQNLQKITHHGGRAASIVKGMLEHSRTRSGQKEPTHLNALADEYLRLAYHGLRAKDKEFNATIHTVFDDKLTTINVVPQDLGRVLLNLFANAFYAVGERSKHGEPNYQPTVTVTTQCTGEQVLVTVADNGTGIPDAVKEKIFQPFFTTKPAGVGTGLGLSLAYDIVTKGHNGVLSLESQQGEGTTMTIQLPLR